MASGLRKIMRAARYLKVGDEVRVPSSSGFSMVMATLQAKESGRRHFSRGTAYDLVVNRNGQEWKVYALGEAVVRQADLIAQAAVKMQLKRRGAT